MMTDLSRCEQLAAENDGLKIELSVLRTIEKRFRATLYAIGDAVIATDAVGCVQQMNAVAEALTGWTESEALGRSADEVFRIVNEHSRTRVESPIQRVLREGKVVGLANHTILLARDGTEHPIADSGAPIRDTDGKMTGVVLVFRDQTAERQAEAALKEAEEQFRTFFDNAPVGKCMTGPDGRLMRVNPAFGAMLGYSLEEMNQIPFAEITHPDDLAESKECVRCLLAGERDTWVMDKRYIAKDSRVVWTHVETKLLRDAGGAPLHFLTHIHDITDRKLAEDRLRQREEELNLLFETMPAGWAEHRMIFDDEGRPCDYVFLRVNAAFERFTGLTRGAVVGKRVTEIIPGVRDAKPDLISLYGEVVTTGEQRKIEIYFAPFDRWYAVTVFRRRPGHFVAMFEDISERTRADAEIEESRAALVEAQAVAHVGSWEWDAVDDAITGSEEFYRLFDVAPEHIAHFAEFTALLHPDDRDRVQKDVADALQQQRPYDTDYRIRQHDGTWRDINARGRTFVDEAGTPLRMVGTCLDITGRKSAERRAEEETLKVTTFLDNTADLVTVVEADGRFRYVNNAAKVIFGRNPDELEGAIAFDFIHPDDRATTQEAFVGWLAEGVTNASWENRQVSATGTVRHMLWTIMPRYADGHLESVWSIARDITERKRAEETLQQLNESLVRSNQELEQFAYVASHDLQEPLRMVASYTQLLAQRYEGKLDAKADKYIGYAVDGAKRMQGLINDLLAFSRVGTRGQEPVPCDGNEVVAEVLQDLEKVIEETGAEIVVGDVPAVMADRTQLRQVFQNLIGNAIKFSGDKAPRVEVTATRENGRCEICVADNGIGIDPQFHDRIFIIFQRLHERGKYPGSGLGLAIVKKIVERHGGEVQLESTPGQGSRFRFTLPATHMRARTP